MAAGVLNRAQMLELINCSPAVLQGHESGKHPSPEKSAIDLPLGDNYWTLRASCRPKCTQSVREMLAEQDASESRLTGGTILQPGVVYVAEVPWRLRLPQNVRVRATAKSSVGRLGVLVRLIADGQTQYDRVTMGDTTELFVEIIPIAFPIRVSPGDKLSQIRFIKGDESEVRVPSAKLVYEDDYVLKPDPEDERRCPEGCAIDLTHEDHQDGVLLTLNLNPDHAYDPIGQVIGFEAIEYDHEENSPAPVELSKEDHDPSVYWNPVVVEKEYQVQIHENRFYIFRSRERFNLPPHLAVECQAYSESLGDIRIHYAGFAHPRFGQDRKDGLGAPLIFEVRGFSFDTVLRHGTPLARVHFWRMSDDAEPGADDYTEQELKLSKHFMDWPKC